MTPKKRINELGLSPLETQTEHQQALEDELGEGDWLWLLGGLTFIRREAQVEAADAYAHWCDTRDAEAYAVYRAAQDRADAAQDELSERHRLEQRLVDAASSSD
jgi:hypothetical protein